MEEREMVAGEQRVGTQTTEGTESGQEELRDGMARIMEERRAKCLGGAEPRREEWE